MNCPRKLLAAVLAVGLAGGTFAISRAQEPAAQDPGQAPSLKTDDSRGRIRTTVSLVVVPVTVKDSAGELVTDLNQNDFRIFDDGIEQPISLFSVDAFPLVSRHPDRRRLEAEHGGKGAEDAGDDRGRVQRVRRGVFVAFR